METPKWISRWTERRRRKSYGFWIWKLEFKILISQSASFHLVVSVSFLILLVFSRFFPVACRLCVVYLSLECLWVSLVCLKKVEKKFNRLVFKKQKVISMFAEILSLHQKSREIKEKKNKSIDHQLQCTHANEIHSRYLSKFHLFSSGGVWF